MIPEPLIILSKHVGGEFSQTKSGAPVLLTRHHRVTCKKANTETGWLFRVFDKHGNVILHRTDFKGALNELHVS